MTIYTLSHGPLKLDVSDQGGVIEGFWRDTTPLLRPGKKRCGNRCLLFSAGTICKPGERQTVLSGRGVSINRNRMLSGMRTIYGDGWLGEWQCVSAQRTIACVWCMNISAVFITIG